MNTISSTLCQYLFNVQTFLSTFEHRRRFNIVVCSTCGQVFMGALVADPVFALSLPEVPGVQGTVYSQQAFTHCCFGLCQKNQAV